MQNTINGADLGRLLDCGFKKLSLHRDRLNDLNVFPVPDGDTGTNMVMTVKAGIAKLPKDEVDIHSVSLAFSTAALFGARGNSGVIISQLFKGMTETFRGHGEADAALLSEALTRGSLAASRAVSDPKEGTVLTVLRESAEALAEALPVGDIEEALRIYLDRARISLENTPNLLPVLKKAGVVDSGGQGAVYFFEGMLMGLLGENIDTQSEEKDEETHATEDIDLSLFDKDFPFTYGYCTETLLQLTIPTSQFSIEKLRRTLSSLGDSVVTTQLSDKVKIHIHSKKPGEVINCLQAYGELLTVKIENMSVQNADVIKAKLSEEKYLYDKEREPGAFSVITVSAGEAMQKLFFEMGADVSVKSEIAPSSEEFIEAFSLAPSKDILVFPNSRNSVLSCVQAAGLAKDKSVTVISSKSESECYAALATLDFDSTPKEARYSANAAIRRLYQLSVFRSKRDSQYGSRKIRKDQFFAISEKELLEVGDDLSDVTVRVIRNTVKMTGATFITLFFGSSISEEFSEFLKGAITESGVEAEIALVPTGDPLYSFNITFE